MLSTAELIAQLKEKSDTIQKQIDSVSSINKTDVDFFDKAEEIIKKFNPTLLNANKGIDELKNSFDNIFDKLFSAELMVRTSVPDIVPYSIENSGRHAQLNGDLIGKQFDSLKEGLLGFRNQSNYDFDGIACNPLMELIKDDLNYLKSLDLRYAIPDNKYLELYQHIMDLKDSYWNTDLIKQIIMSDVIKDFPIFDKRIDNYNILLDKHINVIDVLKNTNAYKKRKPIIDKIADIIYGASNDCKNQWQDQFPYVNYFFNNYDSVRGNINNSSELVQLLYEHHLNFNSSVVDDYNIQKQHITPINKNDVQLMSRRLKSLTAHIFGAASQAYNLDTKQPEIHNLIDNTINILDDLQSKISSNAFALQYDITNKDFKKDMKQLANIANKMGFDNFSKSIKSASWDNIDNMTETSMTLFGDLTEQLKDQAAENVVLGRLYVEAMAESKQQQLYSLSYEDTLVQAKKWLGKQKDKIDKIIKAFSEVESQ